MADKKKKQAGRRAYLNDFHRDLTGAYIYDGSHFHFAGDGWKQALLRLWALGIVLVVLVLEATRQEVIRSHAPGENDLYVRTLELGQVQESDFFSHTIHDDLDSIVRDIREAHLKDKTTADPQPTLDDVKEKFEQAIHQGSDIEMLIHEFCDKLQIPFEKISSEDFSAFLRILSLSKILKNPNNMRGKTSPIPLNRKARRKQK